MNTKLALTAIAIFAVTLGLGVLSPAMAAPNKVDVCHYEAEEIDPDTGAIWCAVRGMLLPYLVHMADLQICMAGRKHYTDICVREVT